MAFESWPFFSPGWTPAPSADVNVCGSKRPIQALRNNQEFIVIWNDDCASIPNVSQELQAWIFSLFVKQTNRALLEMFPPLG
jgi:hypothetical protein